ncbi:hypothetical protein BDY24DRAFT_390880 [Mrakia frigida]|uniref:PCI domain-containing protein n=1 Tax=Mrakia frigida TaxID=29902 RepID=UPI003FCC0FE7
MSVTICADGVFEEQAQELLTYLSRPTAEEQREAYVASFGDLKEVAEGERAALVEKVVAEVNGLGEGTEREVEGFFNLLLALLLSVHSISSSEFAVSYPKILSAVTSDKRRELRRAQYQILSNLHNLLPTSSPLRLPTLKSMISLAVTHKDLNSIGLSPANIKQWVGEWEGVSDEDKAAFVESVAAEFERYDAAGQGAASYPYHTLHLSLLPTTTPPSASTLQSITHALSLALRLPSLFNFDGLLSIPSVQALKGTGSSKVVDLVEGVFTKGGLKEWSQWVEKEGEGSLKELGLDKDLLTKKIRCLTLATLCSSSESNEVSYAEIAAALEVDEKDVEVWVIDVIRLSLLSAKLSQPTRTVRVQRAYIRSFGTVEWKALQARLAAWDENLASVESVVGEARRVGDVAA